MKTDLRDVAGSAVRFGVAACVCFVVNLGLTIGLHELIGLPEEVAFAIAIASVLVISFMMLRFWVYPEQTLGIGRQFLAHLTTNLGFRVTEYVTFLLLHSVLGLYYVYATIIVMGIAFPTKFLFYRLVVFRSRAG